ncbi:MAG: hypothetical protein ACI4CC_03825 [Lachnospiraceae bacterium]
MNKMVALLLMISMLLSLTACGSNGRESGANENTDVAESEDQSIVQTEGEDGSTELAISEEEAKPTEDEGSTAEEENSDSQDADKKKETSSTSSSDSKKETSNSTGDKKNTSGGGSSESKKDSSNGSKPDSGKDEKEESPTIIKPSAKSGTMGDTLWNSFQAAVTDDPKISMEELANVLVTDPVIQFMGAVAPVETGAEYFTGFGEYQISGYESAAVFMPMIGSIAFVGYVFDLSDDTNVKKFIKALKDNCDPRWNICVEADQTVVGAVDDKVFFVMCPTGTE